MWTGQLMSFEKATQIEDSWITPLQPAQPAYYRHYERVDASVSDSTSKPATQLQLQ